ncbi:hypothetical protein LCM10_18785 [Rossellomorea aquimaris]|uniref:hypothetical protein n=1 Tax=Rossellomorea aquimaris TaxID=189382 RepID=UPI001CD43E56|nr:hypothetical protein [Rossellomorea aquimaris]MCA1057014.1 hypothetical protein [Rossellomorea aquimaris]
MFSKLRIKKVAKPFKKNWYERVEVSRHLADVEGEHYHYVLFLNVIGIPKGALAVRVDGSIPDLDTAKQVVFRVSSYNNIMRFAGKSKDGMKDILKRPIKTMRTVENQVKEYFGEVIPVGNPLHKELTLLIDLCKTMQDNQPKFDHMFKEICEIGGSQDRNKVLKAETFERLHDIFIEWHVLLYKEQRMQLLNFYDLPLIQQHVDKGGKGKKLYKTLGNMHTEKRKKSFVNFLDGVIHNEVGDISRLSYAPEDVNIFRQLKIKEGYQRFETYLVPLIRNKGDK